MKNLKFVVLTMCMLCSVTGFGATTDMTKRANIVSYASSLNGLKKSALKTAIYKLCQPSTVLSYGSGSGATWSGFVKTDRIGTTLECRNRYSTDRYYFSSSTSTSAISGMNIEHSFPKSWWGGTTNNAYKDLFNLYPSSSSDNSSKSNYPMGKVTNASILDSYEKVGKGTAGSNGTINLCEPNDTWKGDFCRSYFYMATIYQNLTWSGTQGLQELENDTWPTLQEWAYTLYLDWTATDRVSDIEVDRNNAVYAIQGNRNLFIDYPELAEYVWGDSVDVAFNPYTSLTSASDDSRFATYQAGNYESGSSSGGSITTETATAPTLTSSASFTTDTYSVTITNKESGATVYYTTDGSTPTTSSSSFTGTSKSLTISATTTVKAMAVISGKNNSSVASATYTKTSSGDTDTDTGDSETATIVISELSTANSWTNGTAYTSVSSSPFTLTVSGGDNDGKFYTSDTTWRFYSGGSLSISADSGYTITSVTSSPSATFTVSNGVATASFSSTVKIKTITITYTKTGSTATSASAPTLTASCSFTDSQSVTITNNESGATVYYTTDGTAPTTSSSSFTGSSKTISVSATTTVKAMAVISGKNNSSVASATYTKTESSSTSIANTAETAYTVAEAKALIDAGNDLTTKVYVKGIISSIGDLNSNYGELTYYISDDGTTTSDQFEIYDGFNLNQAKFTSTSEIEVGATVIVYGTLKLYNSSTYELNYGNYIVEYTAPATVATVSSIALSGTYSTTLYKGDTFSTDGMTVTATYSDGTTKDVTSSATFSGYDMSTLGTQTVTVSYTEDDTTVTSTYTVTVTSNLLGDVDVDGDVDMDDLTLLGSYLVGTNTTTVTAQGLINADINTDSAVNIADLAKLIELLK